MTKKIKKNLIKKKEKKERKQEKKQKIRKKGKIQKKIIKKITKKIVKLSLKEKKPEIKKEKLENRNKEDEKIKKIKIRVVGIGGGGGSIVSEIAQRMKKATFVVANTDSQALKLVSKKAIRFNFGYNLTQGLGTGMNQEIGEAAAENEKEKIKKLLEGQDFCIFVACLGGGTGSGAVPVFAKIAKSLGCISYGIFTVPFKFEGEKKIQTAIETLEKLRPNLNAMSIIPNDRIFQIVEKDTPLKIALSSINKNLGGSLEALLETIYSPGLINIDFADLKTIFGGRGRFTYLNSIEIQSSEKEENLIKQILQSPLYPYGIHGAKGILLNIVGSRNIQLSEVSKISKSISNSVNKDAKIILGISQKETKEGKIKLTLLATGCGQKIFSEKTKKTEKEIIVEKKPEKEAKKVKKNPKIKKVKKTKENEQKSFEIKKPEIKIRRNALEVKKDIETSEKELIAEEDKWEIPAFLRKQSNN